MQFNCIPNRSLFLIAESAADAAKDGHRLSETRFFFLKNCLTGIGKLLTAKLCYDLAPIHAHEDRIAKLVVKDFINRYSMVYLSYNYKLRKLGPTSRSQNIKGFFHHLGKISEE